MLFRSVEEGSEQSVRDGDRGPDPVDELGVTLKKPIRNFGNESNYRYGLKEGFPRVARLLEEMGVPSRLASRSGFAGCHDGFVTQLAEEWLASLAPEALAEVEVFACGPTPMLEAVARVAARFGLPCQVSLEEFMACAVGGCAGCAVRVKTPAGPAMKRVCVDGPVFDATCVFAD